MKGFKFLGRALLLGFVIFVLGRIVRSVNDDWGIYDATRVKIETRGDLESEKVRLFSIKNLPQETEIPPFALGQVLYDSVVTWNFPFKPGDNDFVVLYDNKFYFTFSQYIYDIDHQYHYTITLFRSPNAIEVSVTIGGGDYNYYSGTMEAVTWALFPDSAQTQKNAVSTP